MPVLRVTIDLNIQDRYGHYLATDSKVGLTKAFQLFSSYKKGFSAR